MLWPGGETGIHARLKILWQQCRVGSSPTRATSMTERKCDFSLIARSSNGKATCPDKLSRSFKMQDDCQSCPKVAQNRRVSSDFMTQGEKAVYDLRTTIVEERTARLKGL